MAARSAHPLSVLLASLLMVVMYISYPSHSHSRSTYVKRTPEVVPSSILNKASGEKFDKRDDANGTISTESSSWSSVNWGESSSPSSSWEGSSSSESSFESVFSSDDVLSSSLSSFSSSSSEVSSELFSSEFFSSSELLASSSFSSPEASFSPSSSLPSPTSSFSSSSLELLTSTSSLPTSSAVSESAFSSSETSPSSEGTTTSVENGVTIIINHTTTITSNVPDTTSTSTTSSLTTASPTLANVDPSPGLSSKNRSIIIGCVVGLGTPLLVAFIALAYFRLYRNRGKSFINSEGELVKHNGADAMLDEKYFDETVVDDGVNETTDPDETVVGQGNQYKIAPNSATNF